MQALAIGTSTPTTYNPALIFSQWSSDPNSPAPIFNISNNDITINSPAQTRGILLGRLFHNEYELAPDIYSRLRIFISNNKLNITGCFVLEGIRVDGSTPLQPDIRFENNSVELVGIEFDYHLGALAQKPLYVYAGIVITNTKPQAPIITIVRCSFVSNLYIAFSPIRAYGVYIDAELIADLSVSGCTFFHWTYSNCTNNPGYAGVFLTTPVDDGSDDLPNGILPYVTRGDISITDSQMQCFQSLDVFSIDCSLVRLQRRQCLGSLYVARTNFSASCGSDALMVCVCQADVDGGIVVETSSLYLSGDVCGIVGCYQSKQTFGPQIGDVTVRKCKVRTILSPAGTNQIDLISPRQMQVGTLHISDLDVVMSNATGASLLLFANATYVIIERVRAQLQASMNVQFVILSTRLVDESVVVPTLSWTVRDCDVLAITNASATFVATSISVGPESDNGLTSLNDSMHATQIPLHFENNRFIADATPDPTQIDNLRQQEPIIPQNVKPLVMTTVLSLSSIRLLSVIIRNETYIAQLLALGGHSAIGVFQVAGACSTLNGQTLTTSTLPDLMQQGPNVDALEMVVLQVLLKGALSLVPVDLYDGTCNAPHFNTKTLQVTLSKDTNSKTTDRTQTFSAATPTEPILEPSNVDLPSSVLSFISAITVAAGGASVFVGPTAALNAGRVLSVLGTASHCSQFQDSERQLSKQQTSSDSRRSDLELDFARRYLRRSLTFPTSLLPGFCFGKAEGQCLRGAIVSGWLFIVIAVVAAFIIGAYAVYSEAIEKWRKRQDEKAQQAQRNHEHFVESPRPKWHELMKPHKVVAYSRLPFAITNSVFIQLAAWLCNAFALLIAPQILVPAFSDHLVLGAFPVFLFWLLPAVVLSIFIQHTSLSRAFEKRNSGEFRTLPWVKTPMMREDAFQLENVHFWFPKLREANRKISVGERVSSMKMRVLNFVANIFEESSVGKFLFCGSFVWSQGSTRRSEAGGCRGSFLNQLGSVISKFRGPLCYEAARHTQFNSDAAVSERFETFGNFNSRRQKKRRSILAVLEKIRAVVAPFTAFITSVFTAVASFFEATAALYPTRCADSMITMTILTALSFAFVLLVRPHIAPFKNIVNAFAEFFALIGCAVSLAALNESSATSTSSVVSVAGSNLLIASAALTIVGSVVSFVGSVLFKLKLVVPCTKAQLEALQRQDSRARSGREEATSMGNRNSQRASVVSKLTTNSRNSSRIRSNNDNDFPLLRNEDAAVEMSRMDRNSSPLNLSRRNSSQSSQRIPKRQHEAQEMQSLALRPGLNLSVFEQALSRSRERAAAAASARDLRWWKEYLVQLQQNAKNGNGRP